MRVTVGAIRAIVRQEAGQLDEATADTAGNQMIFGLMRGDVMDSLQAMKSGPLRNRLVRLIAHLAKAGAGEQLVTDTLNKLERLSGLQAPPEEAGEEAGDEGSSKTSGYAAGKASDADLDEGSPQTSGYSAGKGSDPAARGN
jgi:hypothetical protein